MYPFNNFLNYTDKDLAPPWLDSNTTFSSPSLIRTDHHVHKHMRHCVSMCVLCSERLSDGSCVLSVWLSHKCKRTISPLQRFLFIQDDSAIGWL
jgi:hypothetical protein